VARRVILGFALVAPLVTSAGLLSGVHAALALLPLFTSHLLLLFPTLVANAQWWGPVVRSFETPAREVWLTIDDGPSAQTPQIVDLLARYEAKATFFLIGNNVREESISRICNAGHSVANHTYTHPRVWFWCATRRRVNQEIDLCENVLPTARGNAFFRSPVGFKNPWVHPALRERRMTLIGWSVRGLDTFARDPAAVARRIVQRVRPGAIILLHEGRSTAAEPNFSVRCLEQTLSALRQLGYQCVVPADRQLRTTSIRRVEENRVVLQQGLAEKQPD